MKARAQLTSERSYVIVGSKEKPWRSSTIAKLAMLRPMSRYMMGVAPIASMRVFDFSMMFMKDFSFAATSRLGLRIVRRGG